MKPFTGGIGLFLTILLVQISLIQNANSNEVNTELESSSLNRGYAIRLLKPLPRRNSGCNTVFRNSEVLESCAPNRMLQGYCEWNLHTHYQKENSSKWLDAYFNPNLMKITQAKIGFSHEDTNRTIVQKMINVEHVTERWIELKFDDQMRGTHLGSLKCYPSDVSEYLPTKKKLFGRTYYRYENTWEENAKVIRSGLSIHDVLDQLEGFVEIIKTN